jgi:hypothetical protein
MSHWISSGGANCIGVRNVGAAAWYIEKLGLRKMNIEMDNGEGCIALEFSKDAKIANKVALTATNGVRSTVQKSFAVLTRLWRIYSFRPLP